jgi:hypothetical protein
LTTKSRVVLTIICCSSFKREIHAILPVRREPLGARGLAGADASSRLGAAQRRSSSSCRRGARSASAAGQSRGLVTALAVMPLMKVTTERST